MARFITHTKLKSVGRQTINQAGTHQYLADEPLSQHGTDAGPSPVQYLLGSLGSCLGASIRSVADKDPNVEIKLFNVDTLGEMEISPDKSSKIVNISVKITCHTNLEPEQQTDLINRAIHICTVHNTLKAAIPIEIEILD